MPDNVGLNSSVSLYTTGIRTNANCAPPSTSPPVDSSNPSNFSISATLPDGCSSHVSFNPSSAEQQYGTAPADPISCGLPADTAQQFAPIMFWFYHNNTQGQFQASAIICRPSVELFDVKANVDLTDRSLNAVEIQQKYVAPNNISGSPLNGQVFNAYAFLLWPAIFFVRLMSNVYKACSSEI